MTSSWQFRWGMVLLTAAVVLLQAAEARGDRELAAVAPDDATPTLELTFVRFESPAIDQDALRAWAAEKPGTAPDPGSSPDQPG